MIDGAILAAIVGLVLWIVVGNSGSRLDQLVGQPAPQFKLRTLSGAVTGTPDHAGKVVVLDFWATWCQPCFKQMPIIQNVVRDRNDVVLLPVNVDDPSATRRHAMDRFVRDAGLTADSLVDDGVVQQMYGVKTIPAIVIVDASGKITYASSGVHSARQLNKELDAATRASR